MGSNCISHHLSERDNKCLLCALVVSFLTQDDSPGMHKPAAEGTGRIDSGRKTGRTLGRDTETGRSVIKTERRDVQFANTRLELLDNS